MSFAVVPSLSPNTRSTTRGEHHDRYLYLRRLFQPRRLWRPYSSPVPPFIAVDQQGTGGQNDTDGFVLEAQPGRSQGRPPKSRARSPSRKYRPAQPAFPKEPLSQSAEPTAEPGQQPHGDSFMPRTARAV